MLLSALAATSCQRPGANTAVPPATAPRAPRELTTHTLHGQTWTDEYAWLKNRDDPRVRAHLDAENAYADAWFRPLRDLEEKLYREMVARIPPEDSSVPEAIGVHFYYRRLAAGAEYFLHCRRRATLAAPEEILLDENALAAKQPFFKLGALRVSPEQNRIAYSTDTQGNERYSPHVKDLTTGQVRTLPVRDAFEHVEWSSDGEALYYTTVDDTNRPARLWRQDLRPGREAKLVYEETDPAFYMTLSKTRDERFLMVTLESNTTSEVRVLAASDREATPQVLIPRQPGIQYKADHRGQEFFLLTNKDAPNFQVVRLHQGLHDWRATKVVLPQRMDTRPEKIDLFAWYLVITERRDGFLQLRVLDLDTGKSTVVPKPEPIGSVQLLANPEFSGRAVRFAYSSPCCPDTVVEYDVLTGQTRRLKQLKIKNFEPSSWKAELHWAAAPAGVAIPISLVRRNGPAPAPGSSPLLLEGYGAYGLSSDPVFDSSLVSLMERGFVIATAHVRGGGELGRAWYEAGKRLEKRNTFTDFLAAADHLHAAGISTPERTAIRGASAGGLLIGAVLNQRPDLCRAAIAEVPFVDVVHTLMDPSIPLTVIEWEEWGNPADPRDFLNLRSYSPYDNVAGLEYPHLLVTAGFFDPRVGFWEPAKWVARLRSRKRGDGTLLLRTHFGSGHEGPSGRYHLLRDRARQYAFLLGRLGLAKGN